MRVLVPLIAFALLHILPSHEAKAQEWVLCGNCVSQAQFEYAAMQRHGDRRGWMVWAVANPNTATFQWVETVYTPPGEVITGETEIADLDRPTKPRLRQAQPAIFDVGPVSPDAIIAPSDEELASMMAMNDGSRSASSMAPTAQERLQFEAIVGLSKDKVFFKPNNSSGNFSGFTSSYHDHRAALDSVIRVALTTKNPAWNSGYLAPVSGLINALKSFFGRGPIGCVTFANGDVGCFQVNVLAPGALLYVEGTAKNVQGQPINESGIDGGNGGYVEVNPNTPDAAHVTYIIGGGYSMVCGYAMGQLSHCEVVQQL